MAGATVAVTLASCSAYGATVCSESVTLASDCGFTNIVTSCEGATATCNCCDTTRCTVGPVPVTGSCTITATLGDGTKHTINVTAGTRSGCPGVVVLTPVTAFLPQTFDSGTCHRDGG